MALEIIRPPLTYPMQTNANWGRAGCWPFSLLFGYVSPVQSQCVTLLIFALKVIELVPKPTSSVLMRCHHTIILGTLPPMVPTHTTVVLQQLTLFTRERTLPTCTSYQMFQTRMLMLMWGFNITGLLTTMQSLMTEATYLTTICSLLSL